MFWFIPVLIVLGWTYYEELDAGSSVQSLTTDSNGKITSHQRDGTSQNILRENQTGEVQIGTGTVPGAGAPFEGFIINGGVGIYPTLQLFSNSTSEEGSIFFGIAGAGNANNGSLFK